jgi:acetoin utilization deacetylase AcuC-like enzyme
MLALHGRVEQVAPDEAAFPQRAVEAAILDVHTAAHMEMIRAAVARAAAEGQPVSVEAETRVSDASWDAATGSVQAGLTAAAAVARGTLRNAFVAARPPGHHAGPDSAMGFCLFNTVAVTARWLRAQGHAERVLIVDWDVHHGNGTQEVFWEDPDVFYLSLHQHPWFPGTGSTEERGGGAGVGTTLNVPLRAGTSRALYRERFEEALDDAFHRFSPDFVLVSAGYDALEGDPLGELTLRPEDFHHLTRVLLRRAERTGISRLVACLEGGYDPRATGLATVATLRALAGVDQADPTLPVDEG